MSRTGWIQEKDGKQAVIPPPDSAGVVRKRRVLVPSPWYLLHSERGKVVIYDIVLKLIPEFRFTRQPTDPTT